MQPPIWKKNVQVEGFADRNKLAIQGELQQLDDERRGIGPMGFKKAKAGIGTVRFDLGGGIFDERDAEELEDDPVFGGVAGEALFKREAKKAKDEIGAIDLELSDPSKSNRKRLTKEERDATLAGAVNLQETDPLHIEGKRRLIEDEELQSLEKRKYEAQKRLYELGAMGVNGFRERRLNERLNSTAEQEQALREQEQAIRDREQAGISGRDLDAHQAEKAKIQEQRAMVERQKQSLGGILADAESVFAEAGAIAEKNAEIRKQNEAARRGAQVDPEAEARALVAQTIGTGGFAKAVAGNRGGVIERAKDALNDFDFMSFIMRGGDTSKMMQDKAADYKIMVDRFKSDLADKGFTGAEADRIVKDAATEYAWTEKDDDRIRQLSTGEIVINPTKVTGDTRKQVVADIEASKATPEQKQIALRRVELMREMAADKIEETLFRNDTEFREFQEQNATMSKPDLIDAWQKKMGDRWPTTKAAEAVVDAAYQAMLSISSTALGVGAGISSGVGADALAGNLGESALLLRDAGSEQQQAMQQRGITGGYALGGDILRTIGEMAPMIKGARIASEIANPLARAATMGMSVYGYSGGQGFSSKLVDALEMRRQELGRDLTQQEVADHIKRPEVMAAAIGNAAQIMLLQAAMPKGVESITKAAPVLTVADLLKRSGRKQLIDGGFRSEIKKMVKNIFPDVMDESIEEGLSQMADEAISSVALGKDVGLGDLIENTLVASLMGGLVGGLVPQMRFSPKQKTDAALVTQGQAPATPEEQRRMAEIASPAVMQDPAQAAQFVSAIREIDAAAASDPDNGKAIAARASGLLKIAAGKPLSLLTGAELDALQIDSNGDSLVKDEQGKPIKGQPSQFIIKEGEQVIIRDEGINALKSIAPSAGDFIAMSETKAREKFTLPKFRVTSREGNVVEVSAKDQNEARDKAAGIFDWGDMVDVVEPIAAAPAAPAAQQPAAGAAPAAAAQQPEIPADIADQPSPNLPLRSTESAPPRPQKRGEARDEWDEKYGDMRKGGKTHNHDGSPYKPTVFDEVSSQINEDTAGFSDDQRVDALGESSEVSRGANVRKFLNDGWIWNRQAKRFENPRNSSETPAEGLARMRTKSKPATPAASSTPAAAPSPKSLEKAANLAKGDVGTYEAARQTNPDLPEPVAAVQAAIQAGKPVSESMMQLAMQGQPTPEGYALDKGVWKKQAKAKQSVVRSVIDKSKKSSKLTQDSLVEVDDGGVLVRMVDDQIQINVAAVEKRAAEMNLGEAGTRKWVSGIIDEEVRHLVQTRAAQELHKTSGSKQPFVGWLSERYSKIWQEEFVAKGKADIVRALYGPNLDKMPEWKRAMEGERMLWQQKYRGQVTEVARLWKDVGKEIIENIKATLKQLKAMLKSGEISADFQQDIDRLEAKLKEMESAPAQPQKPAQAAQKFAIGDTVTGKVASKDPNESGSVVTGVVAQVGNGFLLIQMAENKRARMAFADVQSVVPKAESKPKKEEKAPEWAMFDDSTGTLGIPRAEMPQIKAEDRSAMVQFLKARGIDYQEENVSAGSLKPTQAEYSPAKVQQAREYEGGNRAILISADNYVVDGHHQWLAADGGEIRVIRLMAPIQQVLDTVKQMPSATTDDGKGQKASQEAPQKPANQPAASVSADQDSDKLSATLSFPSREAAQAFAKAWGRHSTRGSDMSKTGADGVTSVTVYGVTDADKQWIDSFVASQQEPAAQPEAETHTFYTPDPNEEVVAHGTVKVVSAAELEKMALAEISDEQARLRTAQNANSNAQIASIGANPDPRRLLAVDASSAEGPPTVYDGKVLAGNGRTMGLALAYRSGNANKYKEATLKKAKQMGIEVDPTIDDPVMIRLATRFENGTPQRFADKSNSQGMLELSPAELAKVDAQTLGNFAAVETTDAGMFTAATIRDVAMAFDKDGRKKVTRETNGEPSRKDVSERIRNAALAGLFDKAGKPMADLLGAMESDEGARLVSIIASSASRFMALDADLSLANELTDALIEVQAGIRAVEEKTFKNLREWQKNRGQDLVARTDISEAGLWIVDKMVEAQKRPTILKGILSEYLNIAEIEQQQRNEAAQSDDIFGEQRQPRNILAEFIASPDGGASLASKAESLKGEADALANQGTPPSEEQVAELEQQIAEAEQELPPQEPSKPKIELTDAEKALEDASEGLFASDLEVESMPKPPSETAFMRAINRYEQEAGTKRRREIPELWDSIYAEEEAADAAYEKSLQKWLDSIPQNRPISFESEGRDGLPNYNVVTRNASDKNRPWRTTMFVTMPRPDWTIEEEIEYEDLFKKTRWYSNSPEYYKWNERLNDLGSRPIVPGATRIVPYMHEEFKTRIEAVMKAQQGSLEPKIGALFASDLGDAPTFSENIPAEKMPQMITAATAMIKGGIETPEGMANSVVRIEIKNDKIGALRRYSESIWSMFRAVKNTLQKDVDWAKAYAKADADNGVTKPAIAAQGKLFGDEAEPTTEPKQAELASETIRKAASLMRGGIVSKTPTFDPLDMMGDRNKDMRVEVMSALLGRKATVKESGVTNIQKKFAEMLNVDERDVPAALRSMLEPKQAESNQDAASSAEEILTAARNKAAEYLKENNPAGLEEMQQNPAAFPHGAYMLEVPLSKLRPGNRTDEATVKRYTDKKDPRPIMVDVQRDPLGGNEIVFQVGDGNHRFAAARARNDASILAIVIPENDAAMSEIRNLVAAMPVNPVSQITPNTPDFRLLPVDDKKDVVKAVADARKGKIGDFGEKIGGARKDLAGKRDDKPAQKPKSDKPGWMNRYEVVEVVKTARPVPSSALERYLMAKSGLEAVAEGRFIINDKRKTDYRGKPLQATSQTFATKEEAEKAIPLVEVARNHMVRSQRSEENPNEVVYGIWRRVNDSKTIQVVKQAFASSEEANAFMTKNATDIIETKTSFREELFARPDAATRTGAPRRTTNATEQMFMETFAPRGVEFGNWMRQEGDARERQEVLNHAYDGLLDLAEVLNVPPKALFLNGELALAFGARGSGLSGAAAHYERKYGVINLTKMSGSGSLAHEFMHALDHYLARQDGKSPSERVKEGESMVFKQGNIERDYASYGFLGKSGVRKEVQEAYRKLMDVIFTKSVEYVEDSVNAEKFVASTRSALEKTLQSLRNDYVREPSKYEKRKKIATPAQLELFDALADKILNGADLALEWRTFATSSSKYGASRWTNDTLEALSELNKAITNRAGFNAQGGVLEGLADDMRRYKQRVDMLKSAQEKEAKTKKVPTDFSMNAKRIDQGGSTDYWNTRHEMVARAFSAFVEDSIAEQGNRSEFLSYGSNNNMPNYRLFNVKPFPEGQERIAINSAFADLFAVMKTEETDKGVRLYASDLGDDLFSMAAKRQQEQPSKEVIAAYAETKEGQKAMQDVKVGRMNALRAYRALTAKRNKTGKLTGEEEQQLLDAEIALGQEMAFDMDAVRSVIPEQVAQAEAKRPTKTRSVQQEMMLGDEGIGGQMALFASDLEEYSTRSSVPDGTRAYRFQGGLLTEPTSIRLMASDLEAWHSTPHKVDKFKTDKIGTGEGAQAYGHGLYFAEDEAVSGKGGFYDRLFSAQISGKVPELVIGNRTFKGEFSADFPREDRVIIDTWRMRNNPTLKDLVDDLRKQGEKGFEAISRINSGEVSVVEPKVNIYRVRLKIDDEQLLDWDKPLSEQSAKVRQILKQSGVVRYLKELESDFSAPSAARGTMKRGYNIYSALEHKHGDAQKASKELLAAGIKGIRYLDGNSRGKGKGSYNYVIFDENDIEILEENGQPVSKRERAALFASDLGDMDPNRIAEIMEQQKQFGNAVKPGTNRAGVGDEEVRKVIDVFDIDYEERRMTQTRDMWVKGGEELAAKNPDGLVKKMIAVSRNEPNAGKITEAEVVGTQILIEKMVQEARGNFDKLMQAGVVIQAYRKARADVARVLASGWDRFMNPEERNRRFLANAILALPSKVAKEIDRRYDPAQVEDEMRKRLTERLRKIERVLNEMGVTVDEVLGKQFRLSPDKRNILKDISKDMSKAEKEALRMHAEHTPAAQIMKRTGLSREQLEKLAKKSYDDALARMIEKVRAGMTAENAGLNASSLMASPLNMTEEEIIAEAKKLVELGLGLSPKLHTASTKALVKRVRKPENEKKAVEKTADQVAARWTTKLQNEKAGVAKAVKKAQHAELVKLMRDHTKRDVLDFKKRVIKLGVTPEQATILDNECQEARARAKRLRYENVSKREQIKWARPEFNNGLIGYEFADKDLTQIKTLVAALTDAVKAVGKIESLSGEPRRKAEAMLAQLDAILGKYGTSALEVANSGKPLESYRFDVSDPTHVHIIANSIMAIDADFVDKAVEYNYFSLLSGPQTFPKNASSIFYSVYDATIARFVESSINAFFDNPMNATFGESKYILRAMGPMLSRARTNFMASLGAEMPFFEYDVLGVPPDLDNYTAGIGSYFRTAISGRKGRFLRIPTRALLATDDYVKTINACAEAGAMAYRICRAAGLKPGTAAFDQKMKELVNVPGSMAWRLAAEKAYRRTFTNALPGQTDQATGEKREVRTAGEAIGMVVGKANSLLNAKVDHMAAKVALTAIRLLFFPFVKVPYNIIATSLSYTPLSALEVAQLYVQYRGIKDPNDRMRAKAEVIERMTRTMQGTMLAALVMGFAGEGDDDDLEKPLLVTGSRPYSATKAGVREAAERLGIGPYTISWPMGNGKRGSFTYGGIEPLATILGTTVDSVKELKQANQGRKTYSEALSGAIGSFVNQLSEKAFMQGVGDLLKMSTGEQNMSRFTADAFGRIVPNLIKQPMRELDPYARAQTDELDKAILYALMPYGQKPEEVDVFGEPIKKGGFGLTRIFDFTDAQVKEVREIDKMLWRYAQRNPGKGAVVLPSEPDASYTPIKGKGSVKMTDNQAKMYRDLAGRQFAARAKSLALNLQNPTDSDIKKVREAMEASRDQAKRILRFNPNWK